jgi:hypothetical protein
MTPAWYPTLETIAAIIRARVKTRMGGEVPIWTADTRPTDLQVQMLVPVAALDMLPCVGDSETLPEKYWQPVSLCVALRTAMLIELSYFPEQVSQDRSAFAEYAAMYATMKESTCTIISNDPDVANTSDSIPTATFPGYGWVWLDPPGDVAGLVGSDGSTWTLNDVIRRLEKAGG